MEIEKSEYERLLKASTEVENLTAKNKQLEEETKNKAVAIEEARKKLTDKEKEFKAELAKKDEDLSKIKTTIGLKDEDDLDTKLAELTENNTKYGELIAKQEAERKTRIDSYKTTLGEEFLKAKEVLLDGLSEEKQEILLKEFVDLQNPPKDDGKGGEKPKVGVHTGNDFNKDSNPKSTSDFEKLVAGGADGNTLIGSLANNFNL